MENNVKVQDDTQSLQSCVSGSLLLTEEILNEYREYVLRTGLADRKSMQNWLEKTMSINRQ